MPTWFFFTNPPPAPADYDETFDVDWDDAIPVPTPSFATPDYNETFDTSWDGTP